MSLKKTIPIIIIILLIFVFRGEEQEQEIYIISGEDIEIIESDFIYNHVDSESFPTVVRSSGKKPVETEYKGIELSKLFSSLEIDIYNIERLTFNAYDGYKIALSLEEIMEPKNVYLTYERDNKKMRSKERGGNGPYQIVIRRDPFSQRWIKHVEEIILE